MSSGGCQVVLGMDGKAGVIPLVGKEWRDTSGDRGYIVIYKLCQRKEGCPIVLLVVAINMEVLLESLVGAFCLPITLGVISRHEVEIHV